MGKHQRRKGKVGEREAAKALSEATGHECRRGQQYNGLEGQDVVGIPGVHIECKRTEKLSLYPAMQQARRDADGKVPVVVHRKNKEEWVLIVPVSEVKRFCECVLLNTANNKAE